MNARMVPVFSNRLEALRHQVDAFREQVAVEQVRVDALSRTHPFHRTQPETVALNMAIDRLHAATQGLSNAERLYATAVDVWDGQDEPRVVIRVCPSCRSALPDGWFTEAGTCDDCSRYGRSPPGKGSRKPYDQRRRTTNSS